MSSHFGTVSTLSIFFINQPLFLQNTTPLYPNIYLGLGFEFEFGPQRIRNLAIMCPYSVECAFTEIRYNHFVLSHQNCIHVLRSRRNVLNSWCNQSQCKPARTHSISGLKSRVLKLTFLP